jgi:hypothetical protein
MTRRRFWFDGRFRQKLIAPSTGFKGTIAGEVTLPAGTEPKTGSIRIQRKPNRALRSAVSLCGRSGPLSIRLSRGEIMSDMAVETVAGSAPAGGGLTQWQRVVNTFVAPSKTFEDIRLGNKSWWLPFLIFALIGYLFFAAVYFKIGMTQVVQNQMHLTPKQEEKMAQMPPEQREKTIQISTYVTEGVFIANPLMVLGGVALLSLGLWGTINFVFAGKATYKGIFAVWMFASLPSIVKTLLGTIVIFAGSDPESFNIKNFAPTNVASFLNPMETNQALYAFANALDVVGIWSLVLLAIGTATVAGVKRTSGYIAVFGWWAIFVLIGVGFAAISS